jgi:hypothetical protein
MHREQHGNSRAPHAVFGAGPRCCRLARRSRPQQRAQPGQRGHQAGCQFHAQQRRRNPAKPARDAAGHHSSITNGQLHAHRLHHRRPAHAPAADHQLRERIPAGAEHQNNSPDRTPHHIGPSDSTPITPAQSHRSVPEPRAQGPTNSDRAQRATDRRTSARTRHYGAAATAGPRGSKAGRARIRCALVVAEMHAGLTQQCLLRRPAHRGQRRGRAIHSHHDPACGAFGIPGHLLPPIEAARYHLAAAASPGTCGHLARPSGAQDPPWLGELTFGRPARSQPSQQRDRDEVQDGRRGVNG